MKERKNACVLELSKHAVKSLPLADLQIRYVIKHFPATPIDTTTDLNKCEREEVSLTLITTKKLREQILKQIL